MLRIRLVPVLLLREGRMIKTVRFSSYRDVGDPMHTVRVYDAQGADEIVLLDISATVEGRRQLIEIISRCARECFIPLSVGGGIRSVADASMAFKAGADRVIISTIAVERPQILHELAEEFGSANVVVCIDAKLDESGAYRVSTHRGSRLSPLDPVPWAREVAERGAGEVLLHFVDRDGTMETGYDLDLLSRVAESVRIPVIACGGVGNLQHLVDGVVKGHASAVAAASIFHFTDQSPVKAHSYMHGAGLPVCLS
jgi:imidazole glycerol-phosphate synthase subunit HisF